MEVIRTIMRNVLFLVFVTTLLDLLLPEGSLRGYLKMTMGFFVVLTLLQPVAQLADPQNMMQAWQLCTADWMEGNSLQVEGIDFTQQEKALEAMYQEKLCQQIQSLLLLTTEVEPQQVDCIVEDSCLQEIHLWLSGTAVDQDRIRRALSGYYGLDARQVIFEEAGEDGLESVE